MILYLAVRTGIFAEERFLDKVLDGWGLDAQEFVRTRLPHLLMVAVLAFVLNRVVRLVTGRMIRLAEQHSSTPGHVAQVKTLAGVIRTTGLTVISLIVGLQFLAAVGVDLAPLLTSAGIAGVAIGLAAQNIVRDVFNGMLILVEDQFNVGDTVRVAGVNGVVEMMTLRKTLVRDAEGTLYTIPNSQITTVANHSVGFALATVSVSVDYSADPDRVVELLRRIAHEVREDERFRSVILDEPQVPGVDAIRGSEMIVPVLFRTVPNQQYALMREFRRRVRLALEAEKLLPGDANRVYQRDSAAAAGSAPASRSRARKAAAHTTPDPTLATVPESSPFHPL